MQGIIDRFEGEYAVIEYEKKMYNISKIFIPEEAKEGNVLNIKITVDQSGTDEQKEEISQLMKNVWT